MADWKDQRYADPKSWEQLQAEERDRKDPITWKDKAYVAWFIGLLAVACLVTLGFFVAWIARLLG